MKKFILVCLILGLTACQAPYTRNVYQPTGQRVCIEYYDSFRCSTPLRVWNETVYPKNNTQIGYNPSVYISYQEQSLSRSVYGTMR